MNFARIKEIWSGLDTRSQLTFVGGILGVLVTLYFLYGYATKQSYTQLATGLQPAQTGQAEQTLASAGIPYRVGSGGTELDVPSSQMSQARIALAGKGILNSGSNSFQAFNSSSLGTTDFQQQVQYQQALQQQIGQTIQQIQGVNSATVELVIPQDSLFADSQSKATAAVLVNGGSSLDTATIAGIAHLVASSVKGLDPNDVSITDETGALLWPNSTSGGGGSNADAKLRADSLYASQLSAEVNSMLASTLGANKAVAHVQADLDVDQTTLDKVTYAKKGVPLTQQTQSESLQSAGGGATLPAGTTTNTSTNGLGSYASGSGSGNSKYKNSTSTTTYGIDKTIQHSIVAPGTVNKLDVALLVDSSVPAAQVASLQKSVASLVGLNAKRGDTMAVTRIPFAKTSTTSSTGSPLSMLGNPISLAKDAFFAIAAIVFLFLMRRALRNREKDAAVPEPTWLRELESGFSLNELDAAPTVALPAAALDHRDPLREQLEEIANNSPEVIASQVSQWMKE
jgi:flagellar M-ring protein FliF